MWFDNTYSYYRSLSPYKLIKSKSSLITLSKIDASKAIEISREFLKQSYTTVIFKNIVMKEEIWIVEYNVGFLKDNIKNVRIDANTGKITGCI